MKLIGNDNTMQQINIAITSARSGNRPVPHMLFAGAAGCGKTSTARHLAEITDATFISVPCEAIKSWADLVPITDAFGRDGYDQKGNPVSRIYPPILFIDEIHNLSLGAQEILGIMMEEWYIQVTEGIQVEPRYQEDINIEKIKSAKRWCPRFTLVGATTNDGKLSKPFRDRFKLRFTFTTYSQEESVLIVKTHAERIDAKIDDEAAAEIAKRGRGVPRILVRYLESCRDFAIAHNHETIDYNVAKLAFFTMNVDENGLTHNDIKMLKVMNNFEKPLGVDNLAIQLNESPKVISEAMEPFLIQQGFMVRSSRGRIITPKGKQYLIAKGHIKFADPAYYDDPIEIKYFRV